MIDWFVWLAHITSPSISSAIYWLWQPEQHWISNLPPLAPNDWFSFRFIAFTGWGIELARSLRDCQFAQQGLAGGATSLFMSRRRFLDDAATLDYFRIYPSRLYARCQDTFWLEFRDRTARPALNNNDMLKPTRDFRLRYFFVSLIYTHTDISAHSITRTEVWFESSSQIPHRLPCHGKFNGAYRTIPSPAIAQHH